MNPYRNRSGYAVVVVMCFTMILATLLAIAYNYSITEIRIASKQGDMENALYVAQAAVEQAAAVWAKRGVAPWSTNGTLGNGTFVVAIVPAALPANAPSTVSGWIDIDPGNSGNSFTLQRMSGQIIDDSAIRATNFTGYVGDAAYISFTPGGTGSQSTLYVNGSSYAVTNQDAYDVFSPAMSVTIYKGSDNKWKMAIATTCASFIME